MTKELKARYDGRCCKCQGRVHIGDEILWDSATRKVEHRECPAEPEVLIKLVEGSGYCAYGMCPWEKEQLIEYKGQWVFVEKTTSRYIREDGMSFGVGDESAHVFTAYRRPATPDEAREAQVKKEAATAEVAREQRFSEIRQMAQTHKKQLPYEPNDTLPEDAEEIGRKTLVGLSGEFGDYTWYLHENQIIEKYVDAGLVGRDWLMSAVITKEQAQDIREAFTSKANLLDGLLPTGAVDI